MWKNALQITKTNRILTGFSPKCPLYSTTTGEPGEEEPSKPWYKRWGSKKDAEESRRAELDRELGSISAEHEQALEEIRRAELNRKRNKSRLRASDRRMLHGFPPLEGLEFERNDRHRTSEFKMRMLGMYGAEKSGISPEVCWPNEEELSEKREWEHVFYDGNTDLKSRMRAAASAEKAKADRIREREEEIERGFEAMRLETEKWKKRIEAKNKSAQREKEKRDRVLAELRQEYGYDLDPNVPHFAEKIAEKEKEIAKAAKAEKKAKKKEEAEAAKKANQGWNYLL